MSYYGNGYSNRVHQLENELKEARKENKRLTSANKYLEVTLDKKSKNLNKCAAIFTQCNEFMEGRAQIKFNTDCRGPFAYDPVFIVSESLLVGSREVSENKRAYSAAFPEPKEETPVVAKCGKSSLNMSLKRNKEAACVPAKRPYSSAFNWNDCNFGSKFTFGSSSKSGQERSRSRAKIRRISGAYTTELPVSDDEEPFVTNLAESDTDPEDVAIPRSYIEIKRSFCTELIEW